MPKINIFEQRKWRNPQPLTETSRNTKQPYASNTSPLVPWLVPEMNRLQQKKLTRQEPDPTPNATTIASSATLGLIHSSPTEPSGRASEKQTLGRGIQGSGTLVSGTSWSGTLGRLSPPADSPSSCWSILTSEVFPGASASIRVCAAARGFCGLTRP